MIAKVLTATSIGFEGKLIEVECDTSNGLPGLQIVGLGNKAIDEARERVRSAINNSNLDFPSKKIVINLAPATIPKNGADFDLPIAIALLVASKQLTHKDIEHSLFAGELALDGNVRPIKNTISLVEIAQSKGVRQIFIPHQNISRAALMDNDISIIGVSSLSELFLHLKGERIIKSAASYPLPSRHPTPSSISIDDIRGQEQAKRALTIAAAGFHNILLTGPPGTGKTMLAKALAGLLPPLTTEEKIAITKIHDLAGLTEEIITQRPFRSPHHTASHISLIGGGMQPRPGEISLAHLGVLFLDELPEYSRTSLEALRQPLEDKWIHLSRSSHKVSFPAHFLLVAARNPCPCGYYGDETRECSCSASQISSYNRKISGPLLDRFDIRVTVARIDNKYLLDHTKNSEEDSLRQSIKAARQRQYARFNNSITTNSHLTNKDLLQRLQISSEASDFLNQASEKLQLSARSHLKILKVAQTIADLEAQDEISIGHISEALQYRQV